MTITTGTAITEQTTTTCELITGPHYLDPVPAVVVMPGGTLLCADCAHIMLTNALTTDRDFHVDPITQPAVTS
jgi:hypothetical protein